MLTIKKQKEKTRKMSMDEIKTDKLKSALVAPEKEIYVFLTMANSRSAVCNSSNFLLNIFRSLPENSSCEISNFETFCRIFSFLSIFSCLEFP
jgi:hypothetical protein